MSYFTHPVVRNPEVKHPTGIPWMKIHSRNTQSEIFQGALRVLHQSLFSLCPNHIGFSHVQSSISICDPVEFRMEPTAAAEQDFQMRWKCKAEIVSLNFVCSDTSMFLLYSLDSDVNCAFSVLQSTSNYSSALTNF